MAEFPDVSQPRDEISISVTASKPMPDVVLCVVLGEIDMNTESLLRTTLPPTSELSPHHLVIDLSDVQYLGSAGLSILSDLHAAQHAAARHLALVVGTNRMVTLPLWASGLDRLFDLHVELDTALAACRKTDSVRGG